MVEGLGGWVREWWKGGRVERARAPTPALLCAHVP